MDHRQGSLRVRVGDPGRPVDTPLVRNADGELEPASWPYALAAAAKGLAAAAGKVGV